jgi:bifunctional non-homologous end joining protein LigD
MGREHLPLPQFIPPMLSTPGSPFDSPQHLFEIKWDGTRCLCFIDEALPGGYRLKNRRDVDITSRYPEYVKLPSLGSGLILDGELVVLQNGKPSFPLLQSREHSRSALKIRSLAVTTPSTFMAFDLLYESGASLLDLPFQERRQRLQALLEQHPHPNVVLSHGVIGSGIEFFRQTTEQDLEGVIAKRLNSRYLPGRRTDAWIKIKKGLEFLCLVIGFEPSGKDDFRNLIVAHEQGGMLRYVGKIGSGFDNAVRKKLNAWLWSHRIKKPVIKCSEKGNWVEPQLIVRVSCMELTAAGEMRAPVFEGLVKE